MSAPLPGVGSSEGFSVTGWLNGLGKGSTKWGARGLMQGCTPGKVRERSGRSIASGAGVSQAQFYPQASFYVALKDCADKG